MAAKQEKCQFVNPKTQSQSCFTMFMTTQKPEYVDAPTIRNFRNHQLTVE